MTKYSWIDLLGEFEDLEDARIFLGREYDAPRNSSDTSSRQTDPPNPDAGPSEKPQKRAWAGQSVCNQSFKEGVIEVAIEFEEVDARSFADIILRYDPKTQDMLTISIGGSASEAKGGNFFNVRLFADTQFGAEANPGSETRKVWQNLRWGGDRLNLRAGRRYGLTITVKASSLSLSLDGVIVAQQTLPFPLPGMQVGLFCASHKKIYYRNFAIKSEKPQAFVVMQFNTAEYDALFNDVIIPICENRGFRVYRADLAKKPGLVIADIVKNLTDSAVIIAEVTPVNGNVYYEVGYADALGKPVILLADKSVGQLPFDVRPYRTIFYENSIGGKQAVESSLSEYLRNILAPQSF
jgi:hypothetical protein